MPGKGGGKRPEKDGTGSSAIILDNNDNVWGDDENNSGDDDVNGPVATTRFMAARAMTSCAATMAMTR